MINFHFEREAGGRRRGFTIVELLIVIVVIGILAAIVIVAYNGVQARARDAKRTAAISAIQKALEMYSVDKGVYPTACSADNMGCDISSLSSVLTPTYLPTLPVVDLVASTPVQYASNTNGVGYGLNVSYETKPRCVAGVNTNPTWGWFVSSHLPLC